MVTSSIGIDFRVAAGPVDLHRRRRILARFDEEVFAQPDVLAAVDGGDVIQAVFVQRDARRGPVPVARFQLDLPVVTQHQHAFVQWTIGENGNFGLGALHGAQIAAGIFHRVLHAGPGGVMISDADLLDGRKIDHAQIVMLGFHRARFHVIFDVVGQAAEQKLVGGCAGRRQHVHLLPFRSAAVLSEQPHFGRIESEQLRGDQLVGLAAHGAIAGRNRDVVERVSRRFLARRPTATMFRSPGSPDPH